MASVPPPPPPPSSSGETEPALPRMLGRLTLLKLIARGGMGEVFLAACGGIEGAERPCVVKLIRREHAKDPSFVARFLDEARVQSQLEHPGVARILEASMGEDKQPYVVVEYVEGRSLAEVRARAIQLGVKLGWADAVAVAVSVAEALAHVHERVDVRGSPLAIAHRDLSPQNVMVAFGGETKLIDFGTARGANRRSRTVAGVVYAKPGYVAPEVANGIPGDAQVDVYALGVMLWELCAGKRFLQGDASEHMAAVAQNKRALPPLRPLADVPAPLDAAIARMTAHEKGSRASAREAQADLLRIMSGAPALSNGERGVRARVASLLAGLYPSEPKRSRAEFAKLLSQAKRAAAEAPALAPSPEPKAAPAASDGLLPGTRYRIVGKIGEGAGGVVHEAVHVDLSRRVALKLLAPERAGRTADAARFRREAWALSRLTHANLTRLYDFGVTSDNRLFFAMEFLEGETLERYLSREKAVAVADALRIVRETASALEAAHAVGLVHRDIKPSNLFLTKDGGVKVLDFGVVCAPGDGSDGGEGATPSLALFGTPEYMAPEQIDGGPIDGRADVYALGSVLYELLTGRIPFVAASSVAVLDAKRKHAPEPPSERAPSRKLPPALDELVMRAIARRPADRYPDVTEFLGAIDRVERALGAGRPARRALGYAAVAAVMVGALAVLGAGTQSRLPRGQEAVRAALARLDPALRVLRGRPSPVALDGGPKHPALMAAPAPPAALAPEPQRALGEADKTPFSPAAPAPEPSVAPADLTVRAPGTATMPARVEPAGLRASAEGDTARPVAEDPSSPRAKAHRAAAKHRWKQLRRYAEDWARTDPSPEPRMLLARALANLGRGSEAHDLLAQLLEGAKANEEARQLMRQIDAHRKPGARRSPGDAPKVASAHGKR